MKEVEYLKEKWGCNLFYFMDLSISARHIDIISQKLIDAQLDIKYCFFSRATSQYSSGLFARLKESGCVYILWGAESGSRKILDLMVKGVKPEEMAAVLQSSHEAGIKNYIFVLLGFPGETAADLYETSLFIGRNYQYIDFVCTSFFVLDRNSSIYKQQEKYKIILGRKFPFIEKNNETLLSTHLFEFKALEGSPVEDLSEYIKKYHQLYWGPLYLGVRGGIYYEHLLSLFLDRQETPCAVVDKGEK